MAAFFYGLCRPGFQRLTVAWVLKSTHKKPAKKPVLSFDYNLNSAAGDLFRLAFGIKQGIDTLAFIGKSGKCIAAQ